jgi:hypothetical protein
LFCQILSRGEWRAVERHRERLAREWGREVSHDEAEADWMAHYAACWRAERQRTASQKQRDEIRKHRWLESEKAQRDLGRAAELDWVARYAKTWRDWFEEHYDDDHNN